MAVNMSWSYYVTGCKKLTNININSGCQILNSRSNIQYPVSSIQNLESRILFLNLPRYVIVGKKPFKNLRLSKGRG
jgi:hypothetical protein